MIAAITGIIASKVTSGTPGLIQTVNIDFTGPSGTTPSGWNAWDGNGTIATLNNTIGGSSGFSFLNDPLTGDWSPEYYGASPGDTDFPDGVLNSSVYNNPPDYKHFTISGLNSSRQYILLFAGFKYGYDGDSESTNITVNGVTKNNGVITGGVVYKASFTVNNPPSGQISVTVQGPDSDRYPIVSGLIIKEYSI